jgi:hypothetical protein
VQRVALIRKLSRVALSYPPRRSGNHRKHTTHYNRQVSDAQPGRRWTKPYAMITLKS